ncbi:histidine phosphatase family protein [Chloroflexota bacterium]
MTRVIMARHGETEWNRTRRIQGCGSDTELNETGIHHASCLGLRLKSAKLGAIYSSPLKRARDTARAIADYHGLPLVIEPNLKEMDIGELEGTLPSQTVGFRERFLNALIQGENMPGGESLPDVQERAWSTIQRLAEKHTGEDIVTVSHYFVIQTTVCSVLGLPVSQITRLKLDLASITTITFDERGPRLSLFNDTCHLTPEQAQAQLY